MQRTESFAVRDSSSGEAVAFTMTYDVTPAPGEILRACGYGVVVVSRDPPNRPDLPGAQWVAPYAANCAEHGWLASRATVDQARDEAASHIASEHPTAADRMFTAERKAQGFRSLAHLDAPYRAADHKRACGECGQPGPARWLEGSASWQPTVRECAEGKRLERESWTA
jgi:hypothetical protein